MLPIISSLRQQWPQTRITWIIGRVEYQLVKSLSDIEFIVFEKSRGLKAFSDIRSQLKYRHFDVLLMMQVALRANLLSLLIKADYRIGYDQARSRDFQSLFCNSKIEGPTRVHVLETFFQFLEKLGIQQRNMDWLLKSDKDSTQYAQHIIGEKRTVLINPCSSARANNWRNWPVESYAKVIDYLASRDFQIILTGGPNQGEIDYAHAIEAQCYSTVINLVGQTSLMQLLALMEQSELLIAPDTGPAHMGTVAGIPVLGLYASSNPDRTGPYNSRKAVVDAYPIALKHYANKSIEQARWGERVRHPEVMNCISVDSVIEKLQDILD